MTLKEKLTRIRSIPNRISEIEENRSRLLAPKTAGFDSTGASVLSGTNGTESKNISFADEGKEINKLLAERNRLVNEVQQEIDDILKGDTVTDIDMRRIVKAREIDGRSLKFISNRIVHINYTTTKELYKMAVDKLGI